MPKVTIEDFSESKENGKRAVVYARYSSDKQKEASITQQIKECTDYIERKGYDLVRIYSDSAKSGSHDVEKRTEFMKMLSDSQAGEFDVVVAYALNRISREEKGGFYEYEKILNDNNVRLEYVTEIYDEEYGGGIGKAVSVHMASEYVVQLRKCAVRGMRDNAENGRFNGGNSVPIGIKIVDGGKKNKYYAPDEETSPYVKNAFDMYILGSTSGEVAEYLNQCGVRTSRGNLINRDTVNRMIQNPIYKGVKITNFDNKAAHVKYTVEGALEAIISEEVWEKAQIEHAKRTYKGKTEYHRETYILRGKLFCGICGDEMVADSGRSRSNNTEKTAGDKYYYYTCHSKKYVKGEGKCKKKPISKQLIEDSVIECITNSIWNDEEINYYVEALRADERRRGPNRRKIEIQSQLITHRAAQRKAMDAFLESDNRVWFDRANEESEIVSKLESELNGILEIEKTQMTSDDFLKAVMDIRSAWEVLQSTTNGKMKIINNFIDKIVVFDPEDNDPTKAKVSFIIKTSDDFSFTKDLKFDLDLSRSISNESGSPNTRYPNFSMKMD